MNRCTSSGFDRAPSRPVIDCPGASIPEHRFRSVRVCPPITPEVLKGASTGYQQGTQMHCTPAALKTTGVRTRTFLTFAPELSRGGEGSLGLGLGLSSRSAFDYLDTKFRGDVVVELDGHLAQAERLDGLGERDLLPIDFETHRRE